MSFFSSYTMNIPGVAGDCLFTTHSAKGSFVYWRVKSIMAYITEWQSKTLYCMTSNLSFTYVCLSPVMSGSSANLDPRFSPFCLPCCGCGWSRDHLRHEFFHRGRVKRIIFAVLNWSGRNANHGCASTALKFPSPISKLHTDQTQ